jgi:hypothetical protein
VKRRWLALNAFVFAASGCNQAPDDDPKDISTPRPNHVAPASTVHRSHAAPAAKYELQGGLAGPRQFPSREGCDGARRSIIEAQTKADNQRSEHGVLLPNRPMLACVPV